MSWTKLGEAINRKAFREAKKGVKRRCSKPVPLANPPKTSAPPLGELDDPIDDLFGEKNA